MSEIYIIIVKWFVEVREDFEVKQTVCSIETLKAFTNKQDAIDFVERENTENCALPCEYSWQTIKLYNYRVN